MKRLMLFLVIVVITISCNNDDNMNSTPELIGKWKLTEVLADPGDGSGKFNPVESNKTIEFKENGSVETNQSLCQPYSAEVQSMGTYKENQIITNCQNPNISMIAYKMESKYLILNFIANEGYSEKFEKVK